MIKTIGKGGVAMVKVEDRGCHGMYSVSDKKLNDREVRITQARDVSRDIRYGNCSRPFVER